MIWGAYSAFFVFVVLLALAPGPDTTVVLKNALATGRRAGLASVAGIATGNCVQATAAALGLSALISRSQPVLDVIRYLGAAYLCYLGIQAFRAARRGDGPLDTGLGSGADLAGTEAAGSGARVGTGAVAAGPAARRPVLRPWLQGALSNLTNPKVMALYLSVLPGFVARGHAGTGTALLLAYSVVIAGAAWQLVLVVAVHRMRGWLGRRRVRAALNAATGTALVGFGIALAAE